MTLRDQLCSSRGAVMFVVEEDQGGCDDVAETPGAAAVAAEGLVGGLEQRVGSFAEADQSLQTHRGDSRRIVSANFLDTITVELIGMILAAFGLLGPVVAAIVHLGSESAFILNSTRLIPAPPRRPSALYAHTPQHDEPDPVRLGSRRGRTRHSKAVIAPA